MLEKPAIPDQLILSRTRDEYSLPFVRIAFLPLGADVNTAVYRLDATDGAACFLKLRKGSFDETLVAVPHFLHVQGLRAIIPPLPTRTGQLSGSLGYYKLILYPFIEGKDAYQQDLTGRQWTDFGAALKAIHTAQPPPALRDLLQRETFPPQGRETVQAFQAQVENSSFADPVAAKLALYVKAKRAEIDHLVRRAAQLAQALQSRSLELVLCHSDLHPGNLLLAADGSLYIVDWDNPILAPKERDLMFVGAGIGDNGNSAREAALFYQGYARGYTPGNDRVEIDWVALAYYRYERIVQDMAEFCKQLFLSDAGGEDREQSYRWFTSIFLPGHEAEVACQTDPFLTN